MNTPITITAVWLRSRENGRVEVLCEIDGQWRVAIRDIHGDTCACSHIAEGNGAYRWPLDDILAEPAPAEGVTA